MRGAAAYFCGTKRFYVVPGAMLILLLLAVTVWLAGSRSPSMPSEKQSAPPTRTETAVPTWTRGGTKDTTLTAPSEPVPPLTRTPERHVSPDPAAQERREAGEGQWFREFWLPVEALEDYLRENRRSAGSLLAASRISGDVALLEEAAASFPENPMVLLDVLTRGDLSQQERREAFRVFAEADPENGLVVYLLALESFREGDMGQALTSLTAGFRKENMENYNLSHIQNLREAYESSGYSPGDAAACATYGHTLESWGLLNELGQWISAIRDAYDEKSDTESAWMTSMIGARYGWEMGWQTGQIKIIEEVYAMGLERRFLRTMDPASDWVSGVQTVGQRLEELQARHETIQAVIPVAQDLGALDDEETLRFFRDWQTFGEVEAYQRLQRAP
jgi:hypothetical protein